MQLQRGSAGRIFCLTTALYLRSVLTRTVHSMAVSSIVVRILITRGCDSRGLEPVMYTHVHLSIMFPDISDNSSIIKLI